MNLLPKLLSAVPKGFLIKPGDTFIAKITPSGREVVKLITKEIKRSAVRYPKTDTIVETIVYERYK